MVPSLETMGSILDPILKDQSKSQSLKLIKSDKRLESFDSDHYLSH